MLSEIKPGKENSEREVGKNEEKQGQDVEKHHRHFLIQEWEEGKNEDRACANFLRERGTRGVQEFTFNSKRFNPTAWQGRGGKGELEAIQR